MNVHEGDRDDQTKNAMELLRAYQGPIPIAAIRAANEAFMRYLRKDFQDVAKRNLAIKALLLPRQLHEDFGCFISEEPFTLHGLSLTGEEVIGRLWIFASRLNEEDQANVKLGMVTALASCYEGDTRVCDQGKTQRLASATLQGYLAGVQIDTQVEKPSKEAALALFFSRKELQDIDKLDALLAAAETFCTAHPLVNKAEFIAELNEYASQSDIT